MPSLTHSLLALAIVPTLALAQVSKPLPIGGIKVDIAKATPMPQGIKDLLVFRGPAGAAKARSVPIKGTFAPGKSLSLGDKLALAKRAASTSGSSASGSSMAPFLTLSRANMRVAGRGELSFWSPYSVTQDNTLIKDATQGGEVELMVIPDGPGRLFLMEWQVAAASPGEMTCTLGGSGSGGAQTFRVSGVETTVIPAVYEAPYGVFFFLLSCNGGWRFNSVEVSILR